MAIISPVSDLRNYNTVLEQVSAGSPVYLTVNGRGRFTIRDIADDEEFEKAKAMLRLMCELNTGIRSGEEEGWVSEDDVRAHFHDDLMNQISAKQNFPKSGAPLYYEGLFTGFYFVTFKSYMAFYKVETDRMLVSRVVYGKSDYMRTIFRNAHEK